MSENPESIDITNVRTGKTINPSVVERQEVDPNSSERMDRVKLLLRGEREISMIVKTIENITPGENQRDMAPADAWIDKWKTLKNAGIPTVSTVRRVSDNQVAMTDLAVDGAGVYGKSDMVENAIDDRKSRETDRHILEIDMDDLGIEAMEIADLADDAGILLASDDALTLIMSADGKWSLIVLDLGMMEMRADALKIVKASDLDDYNQLIAMDIISYVTILQEDILK